MPTVKAGTYTLVTRNHHDKYAALRVCNAKVVRYHSATSAGYDSTSPYINMHHRTDNTLSTNSAGCQLVGSCSNNFKEYTDFLKACGVISSGTWDQLVTQDSEKGILIIDRSQAYDYLAAIYGASEAHKIM